MTVFFLFGLFETKHFSFYIIDKCEAMTLHLGKKQVFFSLDVLNVKNASLFKVKKDSGYEAFFTLNKRFCFKL